jgi:Tn3 transposase DDE domain/Domain of unknown function (DUF4158)
MKQQWAAAELLDHWRLTDTEKELANQYHTGSNRVACALLMKYFQREGRFSRRKQDIPRVIVEYIADQLYLTPATFGSYKWERGTIDRHRSRIRRFLSVRTGTTADANSVLTWLKTHTRYLEEHNLDRLKETVYERYKELKIEPPQPKRIERMVHSAVRSADEGLYSKIEAQLTPEIREKLDALINEHTQIPAAPAFSDLKNEAGGSTLENVLSETAKLERIRAIALPGNLFAEVSHKRLLWCKQRIAVEDLSEIRRHPPQVRYSLLAAFCTVRATEITDTLVELLIAVIHKMGSRAKRIVDREVVRDIKRVQGKNRLLYQVASASLDQPGGTVKEVIYPIAPEQTLRDLVTEYKQGGLYEERIQTIMRGSYSNHYRRMVPYILQALTFHAAHSSSRPVIDALALMQKYAETGIAFYPEEEAIPIEGVVKADQLELIQQGQRINRINYELCVLKAAREKLRCKEIYVQEAYRYRNPDEDLPQDFPVQRQRYYGDLALPLSADEFIVQQKAEMKQALEEFDRYLPINGKVEITKKNGRQWIKLTPVDPQPEPKNLVSLKAEIGSRWKQLYLLDMLKEGDLRVGFTSLLKSPTPHENLPREILRRRLLLCLFGLGTNAGIKRVASGSQTESYRDLLYILHRYISKDGLRSAIAEIANAILRERNTAIWGEATSCASDSKKFGAWDQNLLTEWHIRYRGPGIMVYWHVEKKALCIYSQIKRCSSSEVAAMKEFYDTRRTWRSRRTTLTATARTRRHSPSATSSAFNCCPGLRELAGRNSTGRKRVPRTPTQTSSRCSPVRSTGS